MVFHRGGRTRSGGALLWSLAALAVVVAWGGLWWWMKYGSEIDEVDKPKKLRVRASERGEGVYVHSRGVIRIVAGDIEIHIMPRPNSSLEISAFSPRADEWLTPEQEELRKIGRKMLAGGKFAENLGITEDQVARVSQLRLKADVALTDADRALLTERFQTWQEARGARLREAKRQLLEAARQIAPRSIEATKQAYINDIGRIRGILTAEQWRSYEALVASKSGTVSSR